MGYNTSGRATQGRQAIEAAIGAIRDAGRKARDRRAAIADDPVLALPTARDHRTRAYAEAEQEATAGILAARERGYAAAGLITEEQEAWRSYGERPSAAAQVAGQRLQRVLDAGVPLSTVVRQAIDAKDHDALEWLTYSVRSEAARAVAAGGAPDRATAREVQRQAERLYEQIVDARWPHLDNEARQYHTDRRDLVKADERLEAAAALSLAEARGTSTTMHRFRAGLTEEPWASLVERAEHATWSDPEGVGPVPEAVEA